MSWGRPERKSLFPLASLRCAFCRFVSCDDHLGALVCHHSDGTAVHALCLNSAFPSGSIDCCSAVPASDFLALSFAMSHVDGFLRVCASWKNDQRLNSSWLKSLFGRSDIPTRSDILMPTLSCTLDYHLDRVKSQRVGVSPLLFADVVVRRRQHRCASAQAAHLWCGAQACNSGSHSPSACSRLTSPPNMCGLFHHAPAMLP